jgi:hypothetical protein
MNDLITARDLHPGNTHPAIIAAALEDEREREREVALIAQAEEWNASELQMFAYMVEMAKERLQEINAQHEEGKR